MDTNNKRTQTPSKRKTWLWVLGWIFVFPLPLTILLLRKKDMKPVLKYGAIAAAWVVFLVIGVAGMNNKTEEIPEQSSVSETEAVVRSIVNGSQNERTADSSTEPQTSELPTETVTPTVEPSAEITETEEVPTTTVPETTPAPTEPPTTKAPETQAPTEPPTTKAPETQAPTEPPTTKNSEQASKEEERASISKELYTGEVPYVNNTTSESVQAGDEHKYVWIPLNGGTKYHSYNKKGCSNMNDPLLVTLKTAREHGFVACGRCGGVPKTID